MNITNDTITFDEADFAELSDAAKAALVPYCGTNPFHSLLSDIANNHLLTAKRTAWAAAETPELVPLVVNFRQATQEAKAAVVASLKTHETYLTENVKVEAVAEVALDTPAVLGDVEK